MVSEREEERERKEERMSEGKKSEKSDLLAYFIFMLKSVMVKNTGFDQMQKDKYCYDLTYMWNIKYSQKLRGQRWLPEAGGRSGAVGR